MAITPWLLATTGSGARSVPGLRATQQGSCSSDQYTLCEREFLGIKAMWNTRLSGGQQVEVLSDLHEFSLADLANQDNGDFDYCPRSGPVSGRWPLVGNDRLMHILPAEFRRVRICKDIEREETHPSLVNSCSYRSGRQLPDLIESAERFTSGHDYPLAIWSEEVDHAFDILVSHSVRERLGEIGFGNWIELRVYCFFWGHIHFCC